MSAIRKAALAGAGLGLALAGPGLARRLRPPADLRGQVAVVTGGSRGLGLLLARELAREGCRVAICARDGPELVRARETLERWTPDVLADPCDVSDRGAVQTFVGAVERRLGPIEVLVNNAGVIRVASLPDTTLGDFEHALGVMFWGLVHTTQAVLPGMIERGAGRIVNVTSIGGKLAVPHLVPYSCAKFAAVGLSEGLRAELARYGILVTTAVPGLMRTGSHLNATFRGRLEAEYALFALAATLPVLSMDAERAARAIVRAARRGDPEVILGVPANLAARFHGVFPGLTSDLLGLVGRLLPGPGGAGGSPVRGMEVDAGLESRLLERLTAMGRSAARRFHQHPGPGPAVASDRAGQG